MQTFKTVTLCQNDWDAILMEMAGSSEEYGKYPGYVKEAYENLLKALEV